MCPTSETEVAKPVSSEMSQSADVTLEVTDEGLNEYFCNQVTQKFVAHVHSNLRKRHPRPVYEALRLLDRDIPEIREQERKIATKREWPRTAWTESEQQRLEAGLVYYGKVADQVLKWKQISAYVKSRSARQCAERFQVCRQLALQETEKLARQEAARREESTQSEASRSVKPPDETLRSEALRDEKSVEALSMKERAKSVDVGNSDLSGFEETLSESLESSDEEASSSSVEHAAPLAGETAPATAPAHSGQTLNFKGLEIENIGVVSLVRLRLILCCARCSKKSDIALAMSRPGTSSAPSSFTECPHCHCGIRTSGISFFAHGAGNENIAQVVVDGGSVSEVLPSDYLTSCASCDSNLRYAEVYSALRRSSVCRHCHSKTSLYFAHIQITGSQGPSSATAFLPPVRKKKEKDPFLLTVGQPLPKNGSCSHYKKSFRWFRFPCCLKAFPCDKCHDAISNHKAADLANRVICGLCSREQAATNDTCVCGSQMVATKSKHWEGGKGCRDPTVMSRKDDKKYKLLNKQKMALAKAKSGKK
eukprot:Gregarina_sp_Poly_1__577@NODE_1137_length_4975_cov_105_293602_g667_i2_p1_GENE_NODE_1137_length_4975_cov_105_293602_g667_i2NODE_1137_length_4975_cov_105_293602_g667_i2_p1_ORF_typecomplete_len537_score86_80zfCHY/PF05495_12/6_2e03zfCHY/PF05495_12/7e03zfCHY/PF05495_12/1e04zfCHY/PF05495_12/1_8e04zfCHY/PF05495_12/8_6e14Myb_DNAbinding/PF00249_31/3_7e07Myb_DNAbind_6/PF13921_6/7_1e03Myb_DNAbind_6/PF13921_6/1_8e05HTH_Tnp_IS630/PF01710_16/0_062ToxGHH/PF15636_6/0_21_NODE_1137_length_4975_cov_105_293602_g667